MRPLPSSQRCKSPQVSAAASLRRNPPSERTATRARSKRARWAACAGVSKPRPRARGFGAVSRITANTSAVRAPAWRWGLARRRPRPLKEARTPGSRQGDSWPAHSWALAMALAARRRVAIRWRRIAGPHRQVTGDGEGFRRQGAEVHRVAPFSFEKLPLGAVDAPGVVGEEGLQGVGHPLVGGTQGRRSGRRAGDDLRVAGGGSHEGLQLGDFGGPKLRDNSSSVARMGWGTTGADQPVWGSAI